MKINWTGVALLVATVACIALIAGLETQSKNYQASQPPKITVALNAPITSVEWSPQGGHLAYGTKDGDVRLWSEHGDILLTYNSDVRSGVTAIKWHSNGNELAVGFEDGVIRVWQPGAGKDPFCTFEHETKWITGLAYEPGSDRLAYITHYGALGIVNTATSQVESRHHGETAPIPSVSWGKSLMTGGESAIQWNPLTGKPMAVLYGSSMRGVDFVACSPNDDKLAGVEKETGDLIMWNSPDDQKPGIMAFQEPAWHDRWINRPQEGKPHTELARVAWQGKLGGPVVWYVGRTTLTKAGGSDAANSVPFPYHVTAASWNPYARKWAFGTSQGIAFWPNQP